MNRIYYIMICYFLIICLFFHLSTNVSASNTPTTSTSTFTCHTDKSFEKNNVLLKPSELHAKAAVLLDGDSGRILYGKNSDMILPMASTTKIMTCILVLENADLNDIATVSSYAASMPDVQLNMQKGEQFYIKDLLYSLMLESHNDSAVCLAEHVGGSVEGFAKLMNEKAQEIGCNNTYYITPNGLDAKDEQGIHSTTAHDLALVMKYCISDSPKKEQFLEITRTPNHSFSNLKGNRSFSCTNHNAFLNMMSGALSGKTGFTGNAGYCYVGALRKDGKTFIVALLACGWPNNKTYKWSDTKKLMNYGLENYTLCNMDCIAIDQEKLKPILVINGQSDFLSKNCTVPITIDYSSSKNHSNTFLINQNEKIQLVYKISTTVSAPIKKGAKIGTIQYVLNHEVMKELSIVTTESVKKIDFFWCFKQIFRQFCFCRT